MTNPNEETVEIPKKTLMTLLHYTTERANNEMNYHVEELVPPDDALNAVKEIYNGKDFSLRSLIPSEWQLVDLDEVEKSKMDPEVDRNQLVFAARDEMTYVFVYDLGPIYGVEVIGRGIGTGLMRCESEEAMKTTLQVATRIV